MRALLNKFVFALEQGQWHWPFHRVPCVQFGEALQNCDGFSQSSQKTLIHVGLFLWLRHQCPKPHFTETTRKRTLAIICRAIPVLSLTSKPMRLGWDVISARLAELKIYPERVIGVDMQAGSQAAS